MNGSARMIRLLSILVIFLVLPTQGLNAPEVTPTLTAAPPAISRPSRSRKLQGNNKNGGGGGGNNKNDQTPSTIPTAISFSPTESPVPSPSPTSTPSTSAPTDPLPTMQPTTDAPSQEVTLRPTRSPSIGPTTTILPTSSPSSPFPSSAPSEPTAKPSSMPSITGFVGSLELSFSVLAPGITSLTLLAGKNAELVSEVERAIANILCADTDFELLDDADLNWCIRRRTLQEDIFNRYTGKPILRYRQTELAVQDQTVRGVNYTEWTVEYPVAQIGIKYVDMADENDAEALVRMESVAQLALRAKIEDGSFDDRIKTAAQISVVGEEITTWLEGDGFYEPLDPAPLHGLRLAGIILFFVSLAVTWFVTHLATKRRIEKEWDAEFKERGKGGLVTEEGLDYMLEAGRHQSLEMSGRDVASPGASVRKDEEALGLETVLSNSDDDESKLSLPGYLNIKLTGASPLDDEAKADRSFDSADGGFLFDSATPNR